MRISSVISSAILFSAYLFSNYCYAHGGEDHSHQDDKEIKAKSLVNSNFEAIQRLDDGSVFVPKSLQRNLLITTQLVEIKQLNNVIELNGTVISDPQNAGIVQAPFVGKLIPGPKGMPVAGRQVNKGEILVYLQAENGVIELSKQKDLSAELQAQLTLAEQRLNRLKQLEGAIADKEIKTAEIEYKTLKKRQNIISTSFDQPLALRAPSKGVISSKQNLLSGQIVDMKEILYEIVDPNKLAVEALLYDSKFARSISSASALVDDVNLQLQFIGSGLKLREMALPLLFRIIAPQNQIAIGQAVKIIAQTNTTYKGVALPRAALIKLPNGETHVWLHSEAERFISKKVQAKSLDSSHVAISEGLKNGDRVVISAATLLSQVR